MLLIVSILLFVCFYSNALAKEIGVIGKTYHIAEKDALIEIEERVKQVDWSKYLDRNKMKEALKNYKPSNLKSLPKAKRDRVFTVDMTYTLEFDIPDGRGGILYPKGYTFNPLDYITFPNTLVIIDGSSREQINWFKRSKYINDINTMLLISNGSYWDIAEELKRPVFYATTSLLKKFRIQSVPSVVYQRGRLMEVKEFEIKEKSY